MSTSTQTLTRWYDDGVAQGASHMVVVCDTYDWEDYPVYVMPDKDPTLDVVIQKHHNVNMQRIMEIYNLSMDRNEQLTPGKRVWNL